MIKCVNFKQRTKKGIIYGYCSLRRQEVPLNASECYVCTNKEYKKYKPIKKVSKKRVCVTKETYNIVLERDKGVCRLCGNNNIELHHIYYRSERKDLINDPDNCIMLCNKCHRLAHSNKKKYQPILLEMNK